MRLTVLVDNNTYIDRYYVGEPALCFYLEEDGRRYLFDTGYSDIYRKNAAKLGIDLSALDGVVISHGHNDHTNGLQYFAEIDKKPVLIAHPGFLERKRDGGLEISPPLTEEELARRFTLQLSSAPVALSDNLIFLGEIPRVNAFENRLPVGERLTTDGWQPDYVRDDSALVYRKGDAIYIITGCSHAGICNITAYAKKVTGVERMAGIIGGLHLFSGASEQAARTIEYLSRNVDGVLYPCHCTSLQAKAALMGKMQVKEVGVGLTLEW